MSERAGPNKAPAFGREWSAGFRLGTDAELRGWVEAARAWCDDTDAIAVQHFRRDLELKQKPDRTFVTVADTAIEMLLRERIADAFPGHGILGEEFGSEAADAGTRWYIDPIDGTHNYMRGVPIFGTLIAVARDGELQAAVISAPALGARWFGWRGGGAWARTLGDDEPRRIAVSGISAVEDAQVLYASLVSMTRAGTGTGLTNLLTRAWRDRGFGDFWSYTLVAEGAAEAMIEVDLSPWDAAAPFLLVEEAGGRVTDFGGRRAWDSGTIVATNGRLHDSILKALHGREETPP